MISNTNKSSNKSRMVFCIVAALVLFMSHQLYRPAAGGMLQQVLLDGSHIPVFGVIAVLVFFAMPARWANSRRIVIAGLAALAIGATSEIVQLATPRHASIQDFKANVIGVVGSLLVTASFLGFGSLRLPGRVALAVGGISLFAMGMLPLLTVSAAYVQRDRMFPMLFSPDARFMDVFVTTQNATVGAVARAAQSTAAWEVTLHDGPWPGLIFHDLRSDWTGYSKLVISLGTSETRPLDVHIRVNDRRHALGEQPFRDRFNHSIRIAPGMHTFEFPLSTIAGAPAGREMDLNQIETIVIF
ncbi:MAG: VanZ family protein, partial [Acidiferrobacterales bacterium]|nr:VanZ family protein [Acidiferrobacterales bacterium]